MVARGAVWPPPASCGRKPMAGEVQIGERQGRERLCGILGNAAIAHLAIAELAFHDAEDVLDLRAHAAEAAIAGTLPGGQLAPRLRLLLHRPLDAGLLGGLLARIAGIALVA